MMKEITPQVYTVFLISLIANLLKVCSPTSEANNESPSPTPIIKNAIKTRPLPRKKARLAARLIRATIMSHADPTDRLHRLRDSNIDISTRQELRFVNEESFPIEIIPRIRSANVVEPRKKAGFHTSSFSVCRSPPSTPTKKTQRCRPVTKWRSTSGNSSRSRDPNRESKHKSGLHISRDHQSARIPLSFAPIVDIKKSDLSKPTSILSVMWVSRKDNAKNFCLLDVILDRNDTLLSQFWYRFLLLLPTLNFYQGSLKNTTSYHLLRYLLTPLILQQIHVLFLYKLLHTPHRIHPPAILQITVQA